MDVAYAIMSGTEDALQRVCREGAELRPAEGVSPITAPIGKYKS